MSVNVVEAVLTATDRNYTSTMQKAMGVTDSFANKMKSGLGFGAWVAIGTKAVNTVFNAIGNGVDGAVKRFDTLNNFPKVMQSLGFEVKDADKAINDLADGIGHLPTTLDKVASQAQQFVPLTKDIGKAKDITLAWNNAMAAGGQSAAQQEQAIVAWQKIMNKGKADMEQWLQIQQTAPAQLDQVAQAMLGAGKGAEDLRTALNSGSVSIEDINNKMIEMTNASDGFDIAGKHFDNFAKQAENASAGIQMAMINTNAAVQRNIEKIIRALDKKMQDSGMGGLVENLMKVPDVIDTVGGKIVEKIESIGSLSEVLGGLGAGIAAIGLAPTLASIAQGLFMVNKALIGVNFATAGLAALNPAVLLGGVLVAAGLLDAAFGEEIDKLIQTVTTKGPEIITNLGNAITSRLPEIMARGADLITNLINGIAANIPAILQQGTAIIVTLVQGVMAALPQLIPAAFNAVGQFLIGLAQNLPQLITVGLQLIASLLQGIAQNLPQLLISATQAVWQFIVGIGQNLPQILQAGFDILEAICRGIINAMFMLPSVVKTIFTTIKSAITGNKGELETAGQDQGQALTDSVAQSAAAGQSAIQSAGQQSGASFGTGLNSAVSGIQVDTGSVQNSFDATAPLAVTSGQQTGQQFGSGIQSAQGQIQSASTAASQAATSQLKNGYSKAYSAGSYISQGMAAGMRSQLSSIRAAAAAMSAAADEAMRAKAKVSSPSKVTKKTGAFISQGLAVGLLSKKALLTSAGKKSVNTVLKAMTNAVKKGDAGKKAEKIVANSLKRIKNLQKDYQAELDDILRAREQFTSRLSDVDLFKSKNGNVIFADFKTETNKLKTLGANIAKLQKLLPKGLMDEIVSMSTAEQLKYTNALLQQSEAEIKAYGDTYSKFSAQAASVAKAYYAGEIASVKANYTNTVAKEFQKLSKKMATLGKDAIKGFIKGMNLQKKTLNKTTNTLVNQIVAEAKKKLKIKSPSKVFEQIGTYTGLGLAEGIDGTQRQVQASIDNMLQAADFNRQMANRRFNGALSDEYDYNIMARYEIEVPLVVNGREFARATADDMTAVQNQKETYNNRKRGIR